MRRLTARLRRLLLRLKLLTADILLADLARLREQANTRQERRRLERRLATIQRLRNRIATLFHTNHPLNTAP